MARPKVLIITDYFWPKQNVASARTTALAKYLRKSGCDIYVLTDGDGPDFYEDYGHIRRVPVDHWAQRFDFSKPSNRVVHKLKALYNRVIRFLVVDQNPGFFRNGVKAALQWHREERFSAVISSYTALASLRIASLLKSEDQKLIWVCDLRDELSQNYDVNFWDRVRLKRWERKLVRGADLITSVSLPIVDYFKRLGSKSDCLEIRNGFDFEPVKTEKPFTGTLNLAFIGSLYGYITLDGFFAGWCSLPRHLRDKVQLKIIGTKRIPAVPSELRSQVKVYPSVPYSELPRVLAEQDAFLLVIPTSHRKGVYSGKIFDYLAVNRPILALVDPTDVAAELVRQVNAGYVVANEDAAGIATAIQKLFKDLEAGTMPSRNWKLVEDHRRSAVIRPLAEYLNHSDGIIRS
jgi:glycosyltransferase involved in cell wall biosynthesis